MGSLPLTDLPLPPLEFRRLVGPTDPALFENPSGAALFPFVPEEAYASVLDFGCGCGRLARQLILQQPRPRRYLGIDPHRAMIDWCRTNLAPQAPGFTFQHHDVFHEFMNPDGALDLVPFPAGDSEITLFIGWSVFTHLFEADAAYYLGEISRVLHPDGIAVATWFLFDRRDFPMMQEFQHALFISTFDPTNAVIFDRDWVVAETARHGLVMTRIVPPAVRGFQWTISFQHQATGREPAIFPPDVAPAGVVRAYAGEASSPDHD